MPTYSPKRNRRPLNFRSQYQPALLIASVGNYGGNDVILNFNYDGTALPMSSLIITGIPAIKLQGVLPTGYSTFGVGMTLTYAAEPVAGNGLDIPAWLETVRTKFGGYIAPTRIILEA